MLLLNILLHRKLFLIGLVAALISYGNVPRFIQLSGNSFKNSQITTYKSYKIISFNVRNFDLYNWNNNIETKNQIIQFIKKENPDILCLQEFFYTIRSDFKFNTLDTLKKLFPFLHLNITTQMRGNDFWGLAVFSKYPLLNSENIKFSNTQNNAALKTEILLPTDTLSIYNVHLASLHFGQNEYKLLDDLESDTDENSIIEKSTPIFKLMANAFKERANETHKLLENISQEKHPVMLCGDFNDTPASYCYQSFRKYFNDAFIHAGKGLGRTYIGKFPSFRIDYILYQNPIDVIRFETYNVKLSDHKPIAAEFSLP
jgi:endonuclease/exonuclease/phosphatase family metal-dependent hydrolase